MIKHLLQRLRNTAGAFVLPLVLTGGFSHAQDLDRKTIDSLVLTLKEKVSANFVNTEKAKTVSDSLTGSEFYPLIKRDDFMKALNSRLYALTGDKHLAVGYNPGYATGLKSGKDDKTDQDLREKKENYGFNRVEVQAGNIGYLKLNYFADTEHGRDAAVRAVSTLKETQALIIDLRGNSGGSGSMVQLLCSMLLPAKEEPILNVSYKAGNQVTLKTQAENVKYPGKPLFLLVDGRTFSAGEAFAFILKNRKRATLIGSKTAGAGNISGPYPLLAGYIITIPVGTITDPVTKTGWERSGVVPDVETDPENALEVANDRARRAK